MKLQISDLKMERQWRAATGFDQARFEKLLLLFTTIYPLLNKSEPPAHSFPGAR